MARTLHSLETPALLLDEKILEHNCRRMSERMRQAGIALRPHLKTAKSRDVARLATNGHSGAITVSTLAEARYFLEGGFHDILYGVSMVAAKAPAAAALQRDGAKLTLILDDARAAQALGEAAAVLSTRFPVLIEIDSGGARAGLPADSEELLEVAGIIRQHPHLELGGVMTHAGHSYRCRNREEIATVAEEERRALVEAAARLRAEGYPCPVVSAGSTPTAVHAESFEGLTEMRPGVYVFNDLDQVGIGSCTSEDLALSVLATVISHNRRSRRILIDAGALALSKDVSAQASLSNVGYGRLCDLAGRELPGLYVESVHQEHGFVAAVEGEPPYDALPIGSRLRVLPNHACITAAAYSHYHLLRDGQVVDQWDRINGW
ncbi:MAG TPA: alanine racemase [Kiloniellales bacterium]|nr:alanine racemase [Kiloniellales bacterium]